MFNLTSMTTGFVREYTRGGLVVSLVSIWVLVFLFYYLNRYTQRRYFTIWTASWLFYALWLTLGITAPDANYQSIFEVVRQWCIGTSAAFLLWGSFRFMEIPTRESLFGLFLLFLLVWSCASPYLIRDPLLVQLPIFGLIGFSSIFAGFSFYRLRKQKYFIAAGMLFMGFSLWGFYLATYPLTRKHPTLFTVAFLLSAVLQLFIAFSMIVLVLEEVRYSNEETLRQVERVNSEKEALQAKVLSTEEQCRQMFDEVRNKKDLQSAYDELRQTQRSVVELERLRALGQMASGIAHDVNNALCPVLGYSEMLLAQESRLSENARHKLSHIRLAANDIAEIVARMGRFYRRRENLERLKPVAINRLVNEVIDITRPRWQDMPQRKGIVVQIATELTETLPQLYCNETEVREALTNLVINSVEALPGGGLITISTQAKCSRAGFPGDTPTHLILQVRDNGIGMDEATRQRCFEPFYSTKRDQGGSGLGLAMVYGMMERHEGFVQVESETGRGTTFSLEFPLRNISESQRSPDQEKNGARKAKKAPRYRILCIDDEPLLRELLKAALETADHQVSVADSGRSGLELFEAARKRGESFDLVITDLGMPHLDGRQVAEQLKIGSPLTPIIMLTGWKEMLDEQEGPMPKIDAILGKPPRISELISTLEKVMAEKN